MKIKKLQFILCLLFISTLTFGQIPELGLIKRVKKVTQHGKSYLAYKGDEGFIYADTKGDVKFILAAPKERIKLLKYDNDLDLSWSKEIKLDGKKKTRTLFHFNEKMFWLAEEKTGKNKIDFFVNHISLEGQKGNWSKVASFIKKASNDKPIIWWKASPNKNGLYLLIVDDNFDSKKYNFNIEILKFNKKSEFEWSKNIDFDKTQFELELQKFEVDNAGILSLVIAERNSINKEAEYEKKLVRYNSNTEERKEISLSISPKHSIFHNIKLLEGGRIIYSGLFSNNKGEKNEETNINGFYLFDIDRNGTIANETIHNFSKGDLKNAGEHNVINGTKYIPGLNNRFKFSEIHYDKKENIFSLILEDKERTRFKGVRASKYNAGVSSSYHYKNKDIIYFFIDDKGKLVGSGNIPRFQESVNTELPNGFVTELIESKGLYFTYNESKKNSEKNFNEKYGKRFKNLMIVSAFAGYDGKRKKYVHQNSSKGNMFFYPSWTEDLNENSKLIHLNKRSGLNIGRITY